MELVTIFLFVLALVLALGHLLLYLTRPRAGGGRAAAGSPADVQEEKLAEVNSADLSARYKALNEKIRMAHSRLGDLERVVLDVADAKKIKDSRLIESRLQNFDNFRANTSVELKAIKEILGEMQENKNKKGRKGKEADLSGEEMHKIIYGSRKKSAG